MSNVLDFVKFRSAEEQCREHVERQREAALRDAARAALSDYLDRMHIKFGAVVTVCTVVRWVGQLLVDGAGKPTVQHCSRFLARAIAKGVVKRMLTAGRILH
jgi:hypothetical protein